MARPKFDHQKDIMGKTFEMPDGYNQIFGAERTKPVEALFDTNAIEVSFPSPEALSLRATADVCTSAL